MNKDISGGKAALVGSLALFVMVLVACGQNKTSESPTAVPVTKQEQLDLTNFQSRRSTMFAQVGDRVDVDVQVRQVGDEYVRCGEPVVKDPFGNILAQLGAGSITLGVGVSYRFSFLAASEGEFEVQLGNQECSVRLTKVEATVTWTVHTR